MTFEMNGLFAESLDHAIDACPHRLLQPLNGARLLITGCTGFFGGWVLRAIIRLNQRGFRIKAQCISRTPAEFLQRYPLLSTPDLVWYQSEAQSFATIDALPDITHILHMAASSDARTYSADPVAAARTIVDGTRGCIELAHRHRAHLHSVSSGAVYGQKRQSDGPTQEDQALGDFPYPPEPSTAYAQAKKESEQALANNLDDYSISRPFAFLGPLLPLDQHFAAGNFIADAANGRAITIKGDGTPLRSYMHPADLAVWLLALLASGPRGAAVNVGSDEAISIAELAKRISDIAGSPAPVVAQRPPHNRDPLAYWPAITNARALGLTTSLPLGRAIVDALASATSSVLRSNG
jgi:dTDP-glucose 4,6-dehydratase